MNKAEKRRATILDILSKVPASSIAILSGKLGVSTETLRKDLQQLAAEGKIIKRHGSVLLKDSSKNYLPFDLRRKMNRAYKSKIGVKASELVEEGDVILLENSTTSLAMIEALLGNKDLLQTLTIITNSFSIIALIEKEQVKGCFFLGGWIDFSQHATTGSMMEEFFKNIYVDKAFLSAAAVDYEGNLSSYYESDTIFQKIALQQAKQKILMIGKDKYPKQALLKVANISEFSHIIAATPLSEKLIEKIRECGQLSSENGIISV
ncbi:DeoR/GlpR family DNA-binding transcription regulator [Streptococcus sp. ZJ93]|uniref:DeoR/GlpR family DNA-binding transcription regulator n=1 Tax=Streptococcus handemini TaxID=3161188 RepID=UPI0032EE78C2